VKEDAFILNAARLHLTKENITALKELANSDLDWSAVAKKASRHGVSNFIYYALKQHDLTALLPEELLKKFQAGYYETAIKNANLLGNFKKIASSLPNKVIPLKGIELIQSLYPNIAIRSMCDIDLLVEQDYAEKTWNLLREQGWQELSAHEASKSNQHDGLSEPFWHFPSLYRNEVRVEIHSSIFKDNMFQEAMQTALANSVNVSNRFRLTQEIMLVHLCTHFCKHLHYNEIVLRILCDIRELLKKHQETFDWDKIEQICSEPELRNDLVMVLSYAHILLDAPVPERFLSEKMLQKRKAILASFLSKGVYLEKLRMILFRKLKSYFVRLRQLPGPTAKAAYIFRTFVPKKDWMAGKYDVSTAGKLAMAYPRYWLKLVNVYVIGER
jgi:hypothetical protein